jgi:hypothetical protein
MKYEHPLKHSPKTRLETGVSDLYEFFLSLIISLLSPPPHPHPILQHFYYSNICVMSLESKYNELWFIRIL